MPPTNAQHRDVCIVDGMLLVFDGYQSEPQKISSITLISERGVMSSWFITIKLSTPTLSLNTKGDIYEKIAKIYKCFRRCVVMIFLDIDFFALWATQPWLLEMIVQQVCGGDTWNNLKYSYYNNICFSSLFGKHGRFVSFGCHPFPKCWHRDESVPKKAARTPGVREKWAHEIREGTEVGDLNWGIGHLPSGKHTKNYWKWQFIVSFPMKNGGSFHR